MENGDFGTGSFLQFSHKNNYTISPIDYLLYTDGCLDRLCGAVSGTTAAATSCGTSVRPQARMPGRLNLGSKEVNGKR